jgi:hypothetical protein
MNRRKRLSAMAAVIALIASGQAGRLPAQATETGPKVGDLAPDFSLSAATRYGLLRDQIKLSSYRGNTVVLAFFFKARTRG